METMRVYRIQDSEGIGPYNSDVTNQHVDRMRNDHQQLSHPAWAIDFGRWPHDGERCGFESMKHMFRWFGGYLPVLLGLGYTVVVFEVPVWDVQVGKSGKQLMFQSAHAKRLDNAS